MKPEWVIRRHSFDLSLEIKQEDFIDTADPAQRNWSIVRSMDELADYLDHLDENPGAQPGFDKFAGRPLRTCLCARGTCTSLCNAILDSAQRWPRRTAESLPKGVRHKDVPHNPSLRQTQNQPHSRGF